MKRDWDLIRKILTDIEEGRNLLADIPPEPKWENQNQSEYEVAYAEYKTIEERIFGHLELLKASGYIDGVIISRGLDGHISYALPRPHLTMTGHDLLDTMRSATLWESIKQTAKTKGLELTFDTIKALGLAALRHLATTIKLSGRLQGTTSSNAPISQNSRKILR